MIAITSLTRRTLVGVLAVALLALVALTTQPATRAAAAEQDPTSVSAAHPFSAPTWFPLRNPADIGCAKESCGAYEGHHYWALDFTGNLGDPVYAAGAGILHVGGRSDGCAAAGSTDERNGNWVWIDHGAGVVSRYHHLDTITAKDGQLVTPATQIGTMGHSGDNEPCAINYLHFEVRVGGVKGVRVDPGQLSVCTGDGQVAMPQTFGVTSWDDPKIHIRPRIKTLAGTNSCITPTWLAGPERPAAKVTRQSGALNVSWAAPAAGTQVVLALETYKPSLKAWSGPAYVTATAGATSHRFTGLQNGRPYRVSASLRTSAGTSAPSATTQLIPADAPGAPTGPRYASWTKRDYIHYGWNRPANNGSSVTSFTVAWRCTVKGKALPASWHTATQGEKDTYRNLRGLSKVNVCQVKVRATNAVGTGAWSTTTTVRLGAA